MVDSSLTVGDGRTVAFTDLGDPDGSPVFYFHGAPTSRLDLVGFDSGFASSGIRVISPDRPGYGGSTPRPGRSLNDWPSDVAELAEHLGIDRFAVIGCSAGGPYAVVCASAMPDRVTSAAVVAGVADSNWAGAWVDKPELDATAMRLGDEIAAASLYEEHWGPDGSGFFEQSGDLPPADEAVLADPEQGGRLIASAIEAFRPGVGGYAQDMTISGQGWTFDPAEINVPLTVLHGEADTMVPVSHGHHTAEVIPTASLTTLRNHGHLSILEEIPGLVVELAHPSG